MSDVNGKARYLAKTVVQGFLAQDVKDYEVAAQFFTDVFGGLFPAVGKRDVRVAGFCYADALKLQDSVTEQALGWEDRIGHPVWKDVRSELDKCSAALRIPDRFGEYTSEFWRLHSAERVKGRYKWSADGRWVAECLLADLCFVEGVVGAQKRDECTRVTGPLYLAAVSCHDIRDENGRLPPAAVNMGVNIMGQYYSILLKNTPKR